MSFGCAALVIGALGIGGCAAARNELGTASSSCYVDLARASHAVHHHGHLQGVRLVPVAWLRPHAPLLFDAATTHGRRPGQVCLVAFGGRFRAGGVEHPVGHSSGNLAVVEVAYPGRTLLATLLVTRPPLPFGHFHV
ncbi:MAG TPA: hypothetical protein VND62_04810 [Acidimicrobiales bacterium]|nr:hypothetical protein [Acidimicrobiales bacterium]